MKEPANPARRLYRRRTAAERLDTSINMLKRLERAGKLTPLRLGTRDVFYRAHEVDALSQSDDHVDRLER